MSCQLFRTADGQVFVMCMTPKFWDLLVAELDLLVLREPRFASIALRRERDLVSHRSEVSLVDPGTIDTDFGAQDGDTPDGTRGADWRLRPAQLATLIVQAVQRPGSMGVDEISVHPLGQGKF